MAYIFSNIGRYQHASDRPILTCMGNFPISNDIGKSWTGRYRMAYIFSNTDRYRHASNGPISTCIGLVYIGVHRTGLYRHTSDPPISVCIGPTYIDMYRSKSSSVADADVQMKDKIIPMLFDFIFCQIF